jgi:hypothetical protein
MLQSFLSTLGICTALMMCAVSTAMNYVFLSSLGKTPLEGQVLGAASAAADIFKALLPFFIAWGWQARRYLAAILGALAFTFFAGFSLLSAIGFAADNRGALVDAREGTAQEYARVQRAMTDAQARRDALPVHRPASITAEDIERHGQSRRWQATNGCTNATENESRAFCAEYFRLRAELAAATEAKRLSEEIAVLQRDSASLRENGAGQDSDPQVVLLSRITGVSPESIRLALIIAVALLVEIGASLGLYLAAGHGVTLSSGTETRMLATNCPANERVGSVEDFCLEAVFAVKGEITPLEALSSGYQRWCEDNDLRALSEQEFENQFSLLSNALGLTIDNGHWCDIAVVR